MTVSREPNTMMKVVILTHNYRVVGRVYVKKGARLTDAVCEARQFIAVAEAQGVGAAERESSVTGRVHQCQP